MANNLIANSARFSIFTKNIDALLQNHHAFIRFGHTMRGKPPGLAKSLKNRLAGENFLDSEVAKKINIGLPFQRASRSIELKARLDHVRAQRNNALLEKKSRDQKLQIDLNEMQTEWLRTVGPHQISKIAQHYGIYQNLFGDAYFKPRVNLDIKFETDGNEFHPVYYGNILTPSLAKKAPLVDFNANYDDAIGVNNSKKDKLNTLWTLLLTNLDGNFEDCNKEVVHWLICNVPANDIAKGEQLVPYLQPIPPKGVGYQRHVFLLLKQEKVLDFSKYKVNTNNLEQRSFSTLDFYREHQNNITPAGLAFFQSSWDKSLTDVYHDVLAMEEPVFEYDFPAAYIKEQKWFPLKEPFNLYMDKFRDQKQINKEYLTKKLLKTHPFDGPETELKFPNAHAMDKKVPSWLATETRKDRLKWGRINDY